MKKITYLAALTLLLLTSSAFACTIVSCSRNGEVFAAANEDDYTSTLYPRIWFNPATTERYGTVCFGFQDLSAQAIMNEYGLYVDFTAQYSLDPSKFNLQHPYHGDLFFEILGKCKNVKEALAYLKTRDMAYPAQALLADARGNSVIINPTIKVMKEADYQVNTNFNIADLKKGISDRRYDIANNILAKKANVSVPYLKDILDRTHQEGDLTTIYSYVFDMKRGLIYTYFFHNFNDVYVIDIKKELKKGYRLENLGSHFPVSYAYENLVQKAPETRKEQILAEINKKEATGVVDHYLALMANTAPADSTLNMTMLEVALQLVKDAWNKHDHGGMWLYWFNMPGAYTITHFKDPRLDDAHRILAALQKQPKADAKLKNFITEIDAYVTLVQGDTATAKTLYESCIANPKDTYEVTLNRATGMLGVIN